MISGSLHEYIGLAIAKKGLDDSFEGPSKQKTPKPTSKSPRRDFSSKMLIKPLEKGMACELCGLLYNGFLF